MRIATVVARAKFLISRLEKPPVSYSDAGSSGKLARHHDPVTQSLFVDDSVLSRLVAQLQDGGALPPEVQAVRDTVADIPLMDSVAEGPHAVATKIGAASRAPTWSWIASSMKLKQNLSEVEQWRGNGTLDVQAL